MEKAGAGTVQKAVTLKNGKRTAGGKNVRADASRKRILAAARSIFARYPYGSAGVRKIEEEGGFNYALLRYYFGSKKGLFEAVADELAAEYIHQLLPVIRKIMVQADSETTLNRLVDEMFDFGFDHPDGPATIMLNIGQTQLLDGTLLGLSTMRRYFSRVTEIFSGSNFFPATDEEISMLIFALTLLVANFIGARAFHAAALNLDSESREYRQWVKEAVLSVYGPVLKAALNNRNTAEPEIALTEEANGYISRTPPRPVRISKKQTKGEITREKILDAAEAVFAGQPYNTASIRQIGHEGGFDFTIIHHYFPTKKELAEAVGDRFYNDFFQQSAFWLSLVEEGIRNREPLSSGVSVYIGSLLDYLFENRRGPAIMMQNIALSNPRQALPAFDFSLRFYTDIFTRLKHLLPIRAPEKEIRMWQYCLVTLIANCVGTPDYPARIIGLSPKGVRYRQWITSALVRLFYPGLKHMVTTATG